MLKVEGKNGGIERNWVYLPQPSDDIRADAFTTSVEGDEDAFCLIQFPENYKLTLLQSMFDSSGGKHGSAGGMNNFYDLAVFCSDGVAWTSKLLIAAASSMVKDAFDQMDGYGHHDASCLVLPDVTKNEFKTFHEAIFASVTNAKLDLIVVIKVAETLGVDVVSKSSIRGR